MPLNVCAAGHDFHESRQVETLYGPLWIWDWERYMDFPGYCPGQDEVSKSIDLQQVWERTDTAYFRKVLTEQAGHVLDLGSHIGWFTVIAAETGSEVFGVDADPENMRLLCQNVETRGIDLNRLSLGVAWVAELPGSVTLPDHIRLMKVDIEGHEHEALALTRHLWQDRRIDFGLWELSPIFEKRPGIMAESYAALVDEIASYGYRWFILKDEGPWYITGADLTWPQENAWAEKIP